MLALLLTALLAVLAGAQPPDGSRFESKGLVRVQNGHFVDGQCSSLIFTGWNAWMVAENAMVRVRVAGTGS